MPESKFQQTLSKECTPLKKAYDTCLDSYLKVKTVKKSAEASESSSTEEAPTTTATTTTTNPEYPNKLEEEAEEAELANNLKEKCDKL